MFLGDKYAYTFVVFRPKLERRLTTLEKRLQIPEAERHTCEGKLQKCNQVLITGVRVYEHTQVLKLDSSLRPLSGSSSGEPSKTQALLSQWAKPLRASSATQQEVRYCFILS